jgi:hypothetical protein
MPNSKIAEQPNVDEKTVQHWEITKKILAGICLFGSSLT